MKNQIGGYLNLNESFAGIFGSNMQNLNESVSDYGKKKMIGKTVTLTSTIENAELNEFGNQSDLEEGTVLHVLSYSKKNDTFTVTDENFKNETWNVFADELLSSI